MLPSLWLLRCNRQGHTPRSHGRGSWQLLAARPLPLQERGTGMEHFPPGHSTTRRHGSGWEGTCIIESLCQMNVSPPSSTERGESALQNAQACEFDSICKLTGFGRQGFAGDREQDVDCDEQLGEECLPTAQPHPKDGCPHTELNHHPLHTGSAERFAFTLPHNRGSQMSMSANNNESCPGPLCEIKCHTSPFSLTALLLQLFKSYKILGCCKAKVEAGIASCRASITP